MSGTEEPIQPDPNPNSQPRQRRYSARHQARLDADTQAKLEELAAAVHRKHSAILRFVMQWGLLHSGGWTIDRSPVVAVPSVPLLLEPELLQQVHDAAAAHEVSIAAWLREALRRITVGDFPASWRAGETAGRSHDSGYYGQRFMLRIDETTTQKLQSLVEHFGKSRMAARIRVKNARMCRTEVLQDPVTPRRLWRRFVHDPHTAHPTDIMGTGMFTKPLTPSPV